MEIYYVGDRVLFRTLWRNRPAWFRATVMRVLGSGWSYVYYKVRLDNATGRWTTVSGNQIRPLPVIDQLGELVR